MPKKISIIKPDDWHLHLREGDILKKVLKYSAKSFSRALIMPNLKKPILTYVQAEKYKREILKYLPKGSKFKPLMTLYLTEKTNPKDIKSLKAKSFRQPPSGQYSMHLFFSIFSEIHYPFFIAISQLIT